MTPPLLEVKNLKTYFKVPGETFFSRSQYVKAVDGISFSVEKGDTFGLIGESGCGKTTLGRTILALEEKTEGDALFEGRSIFSLSKKELRAMRRDVQVIFQDPFSSLDPRMTVRQILDEPFDIHNLLLNSADRAKEIQRLIDVVGLPKAHLERYPHQFSGGQRQRVGIARALALKPKLIVCDEPVSALDVSIQAQILNLLQDLQADFDLTYLFIAHDFSVVRHLCNKVAVMYLGRLVEVAETDALFENPQHPYTEALLSAVPVPDPAVKNKRKRILLTGDVPSPLNPPSGCHFHPRCRYAVDACKIDTPSLVETKPKHQVSCPILPFKDIASEAALVERA